MKKIFVIVLVLFSQKVFCQIEKPIQQGNSIIGGGIGSGFDSNDGTKHFYFQLEPQYGYFISTGLAVGISPSLYNSYTKYDQGESSNYGFGIGPFLKYYSESGLLIQVSSHLIYSHQYSKLNEPFGNSSATYNGFTFDLTPGFGYALFLNSKVSLETTLNYSHAFSHSKAESGYIEYQSNSINSSSNSLFFSIGLCVFL